MYGAIRQANFTAARAAPAIGAARGLLAAYGEKLRPKAASAPTSMARYAAVVAQVDAVQALTVQNAQRYARSSGTGSEGAGQSLEHGIVADVQRGELQPFSESGCRDEVVP